LLRDVVGQRNNLARSFVESDGWGSLVAVVAPNLFHYTVN
jgi:hypothetical protein